MSASDHWVYQGRQEHGWFGTGTAPPSETAPDPADKGADSLFAAANAGKRIDYAAYCLIGHLPRSARRLAATFDSERLGKLRAVVAAWYGASGLSRDAFRARFLDPYTSDEVVDRLREAARGMVEARTLAALGAAGADFAAAVQKIGSDRWPRFLAEAEERAVAAVSKGDVPGVVEVSATDTAVGIGGLILLGGLGLALHALRYGQSDAGTSAPASPGPAPSPLPPTVVTAVPVPPPKEGETPTDVLKPGSWWVSRETTKRFAFFRAGRRPPRSCSNGSAKAARTLPRRAIQDNEYGYPMEMRLVIDLLRLVVRQR